MARLQHDDRLIGAWAEAQHGVVARRQLVDLGVPEHLIDDRVKAKRLVVLRKGVYALGHRQLRPEAYWLAAVLACGHEALLSHASAAYAWGLVDRAPARIRVIAAVSRKRGVTPHRMALHEDERTVHRAIPVTSVARTILDVAATTRGRRLEQGDPPRGPAPALRPRHQRTVAERHRRHPGARPLRQLLDDLQGRGTDDFRSDLEILFADLCDRHQWPRPIINARVEGIRVTRRQAETIAPTILRLLSESDR